MDVSNGVWKVAPEENCPRSRSKFGLGLALELGLRRRGEGGGNFLGGNFPRTAFSGCSLIQLKKSID